MFAAFLLHTRATAADSVQFQGLPAPARIVTDTDAIPHIFAANDHDAMMMLEYAHARDCFFQMDLLRHQASGTSAELVGQVSRGRVGSRSPTRRALEFG